jgi:5,5'-dehydrodivanillate O-demethylase oxygenase subunit
MLTKEENERLTRVGPGTPCGELLRRYWHPIYPEILLRENPVRKVRILGEDLTLFRDRKGKLGLIADRCAHRHTSLHLGIPDERGLRCCYHGWLFAHDGQCLDQPLEPASSKLRDRIRIKAYPVREMGGLIWAYLGPDPVPLLPRWDLFVRHDGFRQILAHQLPCNWLQCMENRGDVGHAVYLHGALFKYVRERAGMPHEDPAARYNATMQRFQEMRGRGAHVSWRPIYNEFGFTKGSRPSDSEDEPRSWTIGMNPVLFPYILAFGPQEGDGRIRRLYQIGVPIDDTHTWHFQYCCYVFPDGVDVPAQDAGIPYRELPIVDEKGELILDYVLAQDMAAWYQQGDIADRTQENLGYSDRLIVAYREMLRKQIQLVEDGGEPMNVFRDPDTIESPELRIPGNEKGGEAPTRSAVLGSAIQYRDNYHKAGADGRLYIDDDVDGLCPDRELILELYRQAEEARANAATPDAAE